MKGKKKQKQVEQFSREVSSESEASERASGPSRASDSGRPRCPREESSESDEGIVFSRRASGPGRTFHSGRPRRYSRNSSESDEDVIFPSGASGPKGASSSSGRPRRQCQLPSRFRDDNADDNDGALCMICNKNEPDNLGAEIIFWIDCSVCGKAIVKANITRHMETHFAGKILPHARSGGRHPYPRCHPNRRTCHPLWSYYRWL